MQLSELKTASSLYSNRTKALTLADSAPLFNQLGRLQSDHEKFRIVAETVEQQR